jgi:hypothetical protein
MAQCLVVAAEEQGDLALEPESTAGEEHPGVLDDDDRQRLVQPFVRLAYVVQKDAGDGHPLQRTETMDDLLLRQQLQRRFVGRERPAVLPEAHRQPQIIGSHSRPQASVG